MFWTNAWQKKDERGATDADEWLSDVREGLIDIAKEVVCHQLHKGSSTRHTHQEHSCPEHAPEPRSPDSPKHQRIRPENMNDQQAASVLTPRVLATSINSHMHEEYARLHTRMTAAMLAQALELIRQEIIKTPDGVVTVRGLGDFTCRTYTKDSDNFGDKVEIKRISFKAISAPASIAP